MDDKQLRQNIIDELDWMPNVNAADIGVAAHKGMVTLTGHVGSYAELVAAEAAVKRVKGVLGIAQEMEVRFDGAFPESDDDIAARAVAVLQWSTVLPKGAVQVKVSKGWVTLSGQLEWFYQRRAAEEAVRGLAGVKGVSNLITVTPHVAPADIAHGIEEAFKRAALLDAHRIKVSVTGGKVRLEGKVHSWREREAAESVAWAARGVSAVEDRISVG